MKHNTGLLIGRFQPFHLGHLYLLKKGLENANRLVIGIGSSNVVNELNPFSIAEREDMLREVLERENLTDRIVRIVNIPDIPDDDKWVEKALELAGNIDIIIGNNEKGVNIFFERHGYKVLRFPYYRRETLEGTLIRKLLIDKDSSWKDAVPSYLVRKIGALTYR